MTEPESPSPESTEQNAPTSIPRPALRVRIGITLILLSGVFWFSLLAVPFLPLNVTQKSAVGAGLFVSVQVAWWVGAAIAGPTAVTRLMSGMRRLWPGRGTSEEPDDPAGQRPSQD